MKYQILVAVLLSHPLMAQAQKSEDLRTIVSKWVDTMRLSTEEEARWARDEVVLKANLEGLKAELAQIKTESEAATARLNTADRASQEKLNDKASYQEARKVLDEELAPLETMALGVVPLAPEFFLRDSQKLSTSIETLKKSKDSVSLNSRLSAVVTILTELERFNQARWIQDLSQDVDGKELSLKAVYFGLGAAYAADKSGEVAMVGHPGDQGWKFKRITDADLAQKTKTLIDVATESGVTEIVELPIEISQ